MVNHRLRAAMLDAEMTPARLAELTDVDVKTVQRWLSEDRIPYPITRHRVAVTLRREESYLWPRLLPNDSGATTCVNEIAGIWPTRTSVSSDTWHDLFNRAARHIDILIYAGSFLIETMDLTEVLRLKAEQGTVIRILVGDPESTAVKARAEELGLPWLPECCRTTATYLGHAVAPSLSLRPHRITLYASQFRFDDLLLINSYAYGVWAAHSPVFRLDRCDGSLFHFYASVFERAWASARSRKPLP